MGIRAIIVLALFSLTTRAHARERIFQDVFPGARAQGMGFAYASIADDSDSVFYNPAGAALIQAAETSLSVGRHLDGDGDMGMLSASVSRPIRFYRDTVFTGGYLAQRQSGVVSRDAMLFSIAAVRRFPVLEEIIPGGQFPIRWGATVRFESLRYQSGFGENKIGLGFDGGFQVGPRDGLLLGASLLQLQTDTLTPAPYLTFGASYPLGRFRLAGDIRARDGLTEFFPGVEAKFFAGLLSMRAGRGSRLGGHSSLALGLGIDYSPVMLNLAFAFPLEGFGVDEGAYNMSFSYRFGAPSFVQRFLGEASKQADELNKRNAELTGRLRVLVDEVERFEENLETARGQLDATRQQIDDAETRLQDTRRETVRTEIKVQRLEPVPKRPRRTRHTHAPRKTRRFKLPTKYKVRSGDTLRSIASKFYGDPHLWEFIYEKNPKNIYRGLPVVGRVLKIPALPKGAYGR